MVDRDLIQRETDLARDAANKGGPALVSCHVTTEGQGAFAFANRIDFGLTFVEQPFPMFCSELDLDDAEDAEWLTGTVLDSGARGDTPCLPQCSGYVTSWDKDDHGNWIGCWVAVMVTYPVPVEAADPLVAMTHYFTFSAVAIKDLADNDEDTAYVAPE